MELEFEQFKAANPHLKKSDESYADPNYEDAEQEVEQDSRIDLAQVGPPDTGDEVFERDKAMAKVQAIRDQILRSINKPENALAPEDEQWEDVPVGEGGDST